MEHIPIGTLIVWAFIVMFVTVVVLESIHPKFLTACIKIVGMCLLLTLVAHIMINGLSL